MVSAQVPSEFSFFKTAVSAIFSERTVLAATPPWERDLNYERELTGKDAEIGQLKAQLYTDQQINALRQELQAGQAAQAIINERQSGMLGILQTQVAQLNNITGLFIKQPVMAASEAALNAFKATATPANAGGTTGN